MIPDRSYPFAAQKRFRRWQDMAQMPITLAEPPTTKLPFFPSKSPKMPDFGGKKSCATAKESVLRHKKSVCRRRRYKRPI